VLADDLGMNAALSLSLAQHQFAREQHADPSGHAAGDEQLIFMYRRDSDGTHRWLIDAAGRILDSVYFAEDRGALV
jgi:hypothetical protein